MGLAGLSQGLNESAHMKLFKHCLRGILVLLWFRLHLPMQGPQVRFLVGELRSHMPHGQENQNTRQEQPCNKLNKDLKIVYIKK